MTELIKIREQNGNTAISARELHSFLEVKDKFTDWIKRMFEYGFEENMDYLSFSEKSEKPKGGRPTTDFALTIDTAKEISMIQRTEKGKIARRYFIECEKRLKEQINSVKNTNTMTIYERKNELYQELMELIKINLLRNDLANLCKENNIPRHKVRHVMDCTTFHPNIVQMLYEKAMMNKKALEEGVQLMIDNLKS